MPGMDQNEWQDMQRQIMAAALMGGGMGGQPGAYGQDGGQSASTMPAPTSGMPGSSQMMATTGQAPVSPAGQAFMGSNTGGMLDASPTPYMSVNPYAPVGSNPGAAPGPMQGSNPFELQQAMSRYAGMGPSWDGGGGGAEGGGR